MEVTYFKKTKKVSINDICVDSLVYLKVKSHSNTTIRETEFYGKIIKITPSYFEFLGYCEAGYLLDNCKTEIIHRRDGNPARYSKKWAKKSIIELWIVEANEKNEAREFYRTTGSSPIH